MRHHSENSSNELMSRSHYSLSERQTVTFSFKEIGIKVTKGFNNGFRPGSPNNRAEGNSLRNGS